MLPRDAPAPARPSLTFTPASRPSRSETASRPAATRRQKRGEGQAEPDHTNAAVSAVFGQAAAASVVEFVLRTGTHARLCVGAVARGARVAHSPSFEQRCVEGFSVP